jgi:hypothetical protein
MPMWRHQFGCVSCMASCLATLSAFAGPTLPPGESATQGDAPTGVEPASEPAQSEPGEPAPSAPSAPTQSPASQRQRRWTGLRWVEEPAQGRESRRTAAPGQSEESADDDAITDKTPDAVQGEATRPAEDQRSVGLFLTPLAINTENKLFEEFVLDLDIWGGGVSFNVVFDYFTGSNASAEWTGLGFFLGPQIMTECFRGWYLWPRAGLGNLHVKAQPGFGVLDADAFVEADAFLAGIAATAGYQWRWTWFALRLGGGFIYVSVGDPTASVDLSGAGGTALLLDMAIGATY